MMYGSVFLGQPGVLFVDRNKSVNGWFDFFAGVGVDPAVFDPMTGLFVDLMEADFFALRRRGEERDRTRN
jgi:hypothetical protein